VAGAVGLLVFLSLLNQLILFAAALTATSTVGTVTDLATGSTPAPPAKPTLDAQRYRIGRRAVARRNARAAWGRHPPRRWG
jgi:membrane protein